MVRTIGTALAVVALVVGAGACTVFGSVVPLRPGGPYPAACSQWDYGPRQCAAIVRRAIRDARVDRANVTSIDLLPFDAKVSLGGFQAALVRLHLRDARVVDQAIRCIGVSSSPACRPEAKLEGVHGVDMDVPCGGESPAGCATIPPPPRPASVQASKPFHLDAIDIPIDRPGKYTVHLGTASLPDRYLSVRSLTIANPMPDHFWVESGIYLDIRSKVAGRPPVGSRYRDPFRGPEPVDIAVTFEVTEFDAPDVLQLREITVQ